MSVGSSSIILSRFLSSSAAWKKRHTSDKYTKLAFNNDLRARSYYKLEEMLTHHLHHHRPLIKPGDYVIDLGAAPGGWTLCAASILFPHSNNNSNNNNNNNSNNNNSLLVGLDLLPIDAIANAILLQGDFTVAHTQSELKSVSSNRLATTILSDMLQNTTGIHSTDHLRSIDLCLSVLDFAQHHLAQNGNVLCKFLRGSDDKELLGAAKDMFHHVKVIKPLASRSESSEIYLSCVKKK